MRIFLASGEARQEDRPVASVHVSDACARARRERRVSDQEERGGLRPDQHLVMGDARLAGDQKGVISRVEDRLLDVVPSELPDCVH